LLRDLHLHLQQLTPDITSIARQLAALQGFLDVLRNADCTACSVDEVGSLLHFAEQLLVEESKRLLVKRAILTTLSSEVRDGGLTYDRDDVALRNHVFDLLDAANRERLGVGCPLQPNRRCHCLPFDISA
jgi:hypothetical protein